MVRNGDRVAVYPVFESIDIMLCCVRPQPLREPKFVLDVHLGRLAGYLRMLGFQTAYANRASDLELVRISAEQRRVLLTRDRGVLKHSAVTHGYWLRETDSRCQTEEVVEGASIGARHCARLRAAWVSMNCSGKPQKPRLTGAYRKGLWHGTTSSGSVRAVGECTGRVCTARECGPGSKNWSLLLGRCKLVQRLRPDLRYRPQKLSLRNETRSQLR